MKKFFATIALLTAVASPALAATTTVHRHHPAADTMNTETGSYAQQPTNGYYADGATTTDPDAFIRRSLLIEGDHNTGE